MSVQEIVELLEKTVKEVQESAKVTANHQILGSVVNRLSWGKGRGARRERRKTVCGRTMLINCRCFYSC